MIVRARHHGVSDVTAGSDPRVGMAAASFTLPEHGSALGSEQQGDGNREAGGVKREPSGCSFRNERHPEGLPFPASRFPFPCCYGMTCGFPI